LTSKDVRSASIGCVGGKQRPGNGGDDDRGGIVPATGECGGDPDGAALPPLLPPLPPRAIDSSMGTARRGVLPPGAARGQSAATKGECQITLKSRADIFYT
jgi:hypothetical protein